MANPFFSILLPSRNRLELLKFAVESIVDQDWRDLEIVISDNASEPSYAPYVREITGLSVNYIRSTETLSVTENWNKALDAAQGQYIIMLGDDDALTPGCLRRLAKTIQKFNGPAVLYVMAYHYAYPGVHQWAPQGYLAKVNNSVVFVEASGPYELPRDQARQLGIDGLHFRHNVSFNAQHFIWKREYIRERSRIVPFFQSPYPDYFACFVTFLTAPRIVVVPTPEMIIGISRQSFGFYYSNDKQDEGFQQFHAKENFVNGSAMSGRDVRAALGAPGSQHYRNWLLAALSAKNALGDLDGVEVDLARYLKLQSYEHHKKKRFPRTWTIDEAKALRTQKKALKSRLYRAFFRLVESLDKRTILPIAYMTPRKMANFGLYHPSVVDFQEIENHFNILDAYNWIKRRNN
ncbi:glycosyltransferase [Labrys okinawensis]|uniref:glycosyltransferase n=1 Tax=Labrys okinawensis TaxID=346911 RepID=UPI0039BC7576